MTSDEGKKASEEAAKLTKREREAMQRESDVLARTANAISVVPGSVAYTEYDATDEERGYVPRDLAEGRRDFIALHDQWTTPDEATMIAHVADFRARRGGAVSG